MDPGRFPRRILLCVTGLSPQIITDTLFALAVDQDPPFVPTEIQVITTAEGAERVRLSLLDPEEGHFHQLCVDYGLDAAGIRFGPDTIHAIPDTSGQALSDIRSKADNTAAADAITAIVRKLTSDPHSAVHASIAGGRKTMGFFLGVAMSLFGRSQDRLSHVLVSAPFESLSQFYFPPRKPRRLELSRENRYIHTSDAEVTLADIPFVRLRDWLDNTLLSSSASYSETVRCTQLNLAAPELVLDSYSRRVRCGATVIILPPVDFAFLAWFARRALNGHPGLCRAQISNQERDTFLAEYEALHGEMDQEADRVREAVRQGMDQDYFDSRRSWLHKRLINALGKSDARPYMIVSDRRRPLSCYALTLKPGRLQFGAVELE